MRLSSNKENAGTTLPSSSSSSRTTGLGLGKPKLHSRKPYHRTASTKKTSKSSAIGPIQIKPATKAAATKRSTVSPSASRIKNPSCDPVSEEDTVMVPGPGGKSLAVHHLAGPPPANAIAAARAPPTTVTNHPSRTTPGDILVLENSPSLGASTGHSPSKPSDLVIRSGQVTVRMPLRLPRPETPPIDRILVGDELVPSEYVRDNLLDYVYRMYAAASLYRPYASTESPESHVTPPNAARKSMAFAIPAVVEGKDTTNLVASTVKGFEPDLCLAICKRASPEGPDEGPFHLYATKYIVYRAFCTYFPQLQPAEVAKVESLGEGDESDEEDDEESDVEEDDTEADSPRSASRLSNISDASTSSTGTSISTASAIAALDTGDYRHLPILAIALPHPDSFPLIHQRLHCPHMKWQHELLGIKSGSSKPEPTEIAAELAARPTRSLIATLTSLHCVWCNVMSLGLVLDEMWSELSSAWAFVVGELGKRAKVQEEARAAWAAAQRMAVAQQAGMMMA